MNLNKYITSNVLNLIVWATLSHAPTLHAAAQGGGWRSSQHPPRRARAPPPPAPPVSWVPPERVSAHRYTLWRREPRSAAANARERVGGGGWAKRSGTCARRLDSGERTARALEHFGGLIQLALTSADP